MKTVDYATTSAMLADHPDIQVAAIHFRIGKVLEGELEASAAVGSKMRRLIEHWLRLQSLEADQRNRMENAENRRVDVHRGPLKAVKRREAASCPVNLPLSA